MTPLTKVYEAFLAKITDDEYLHWTKEEINADLRKILEAAIPSFKFPRVDLTIEGDNFIGDLKAEEIKIISSYMREEWLNRCILDTENLRPLYDERDFSPANFIDKLHSLLKTEQATVRKAESDYYRSVNRKPFDYGKLAGGNNGSH